jgi:hypothetical protein
VSREMSEYVESHQARLFAHMEAERVVSREREGCREDAIVLVVRNTSIDVIETGRVEPRGVQ